jgi:hypothetical protein
MNFQPKFEVQNWYFFWRHKNVCVKCEEFLWKVLGQGRALITESMYIYLVFS